MSILITYSQNVFEITSFNICLKKTPLKCSLAMFKLNQNVVAILKTYKDCCWF